MNSYTLLPLLIAISLPISSFAICSASNDSTNVDNSVVNAIGSSSSNTITETIITVTNGNSQLCNYYCNATVTTVDTSEISPKRGFDDFSNTGSTISTITYDSLPVVSANANSGTKIFNLSTDFPVASLGNIPGGTEYSSVGYTIQCFNNDDP